MNKIEIAVLDDHDIVRDGIRSMLIGVNDIEMIDDVATPLEFLDTLKTRQPHVAIIDISLPQMSGISVLRQLSKDFSKVKSLVLTSNTSQNYIEASLKAGARGFLLKNSDKAEFLDAIRKVYAGDYYFGKNISQNVFKHYVSLIENAEAKDNKLTEREIEITIGICDGLTYKEIGEELNISVKTVENHKRNILDKLGINSSAELIRYAIRNNIVEP